MSLITMDAVRIESLPSAKSLLNTKVSETTDISKEKDDDILFIDDIDEDDEIRLRLSDEEEIEQDNTSGHSENQLKKNDLEFKAHTSVASKEVHSKELTIVRDKFDIDANSLADDDKSSDNCDIEEGINENCSINEEESTMSGSHHNSPKYWSNYDKRWKSVNSSRGRQSYPHRNSNDWYHHQQYPENNKFIPKSNNYNNRNNPNNRLRSSSRGNHNNQFRENGNKEVRREDYNESPRLRSKTSKEENKDKNQSIKENGVANNLNVEENDAVKDDTSAIESTDFSNKDNPEIDSDQKENKNLSELNSSSAEKCKNDNENNDNEISKNGECNMEENEQNNKNTLLSTTKDCDVSMTEEEKCESKSKTINKEGSECISNETEREISSDCSSLSNSVELKDSAESEVCSESVKIAEVASHNGNTLEKDSCEKSMKIDENIDNLCEISDKHSDSGKISASSNAKDSDKEISESSLIEEKIKDEKNVSEKKPETVSTNENSESKLNNNSNLNENSNHSVEDEKSVCVSEMDVSEIEANDGKSDKVTTEDKINEVMDVDTDSSNSLLIAVADAKSSDPTDSKFSNENDDNTSADENSMIIDETNTTPEEETPSTTVNDENKEVEKPADVKSTDEEEKSKPADTDEPEEIIANIIEEVDLVDDEQEIEASNSSTVEANTSQVKDDASSDALNDNKDTSQTVPINSAEGDKVGESNEEGRAVVHKRRRRKRTSIILTEVPGSDLQAENGVRQKRRSARNAEEMIKGSLKEDEAGEESTDDDDKIIPINYKKSAAAAAIHAQPLSPPSLKRTLEDIDCIGDAITVKRIKHTVGGPPTKGTTTPPTSAKTTPTKTDESSIVVTKITTPIPSPQKEPTPRSKEESALMKELVRKISTDDIRKKLKKLKQEELEALLLQKIVECITIRGEMGQLREEARVSKRNQEATRVKCQQLQKQVEGFDMVLKRISYDKNSNSDKYIPPIKINRSVGLQVNFLSPEHGVQNLKQIQTLKSSSSGNVVNNGSKIVSSAPGSSNLSKENIGQQQKMVKTRSPRRFETTSRLVEVGQTAATTTAPPSPNANSTTTTTAASVIMSKGVESNPKRLSLQSSGGNIVQILSPGQQQTPQSQQAQTAVVVNSAGRPATLTIQRATTGGNSATSNAANKTSDLIDLTDEEDKTKAGALTPITTALTTRLPRVLQAVPASVALSNSSSLRLIQTNSQGSSTAIVNSVNGPRLAYVMQSNGGVSTRQIVLTNSPSIRPANTVTTRNISTISYKQGVLPNGTVRVLTAQAPAGNSTSKHPAPLPETPVTESNPSWKLAPPAPSLKISKVATGIVLSWNMTLSDKFAEIVSYQLYAYQEVAGTNPSAAIWKKVGDVRALPLPMACTLTQFTEGNNYYFAVRAVDVHSRFGQYSKPGNISL